jgi:GH35 family endo-1,4-beta-xylanase
MDSNLFLPIQVEEVHKSKFSFGYYGLPNNLWSEDLRFISDTQTLSVSWCDIEYAQGKYYFDNLDRDVEFCNSNNIPITAHSLWQDHGKWFLPKWVRKLNDKEFYSAWSKYKDVLLERYSGSIKTWECFNEALVKQDQVYRRNFKWMSPRVCKEVYSQHPELILGCNNFTNIFSVFENVDTFESSDFVKFLDMVFYIQPLSYIGIQLHIHRSTHLGISCIQNLEFLYERFQVPIWITEFGVYNFSESQQAVLFKNMYKLLYSVPGIESIVFWGLGRFFTNGRFSPVVSDFFEFIKNVKASSNNVGGQRRPEVAGTFIKTQW